MPTTFVTEKILILFALYYRAFKEHPVYYTKTQTSGHQRVKISKNQPSGERESNPYTNFDPETKRYGRAHSHWRHWRRLPLR